MHALCSVEKYNEGGRKEEESNHLMDGFQKNISQTTVRNQVLVA